MKMSRSLYIQGKGLRLVKIYLKQKSFAEFQPPSVYLDETNIEDNISMIHNRIMLGQVFIIKLFETSGLLSLRLPCFVAQNILENFLHRCWKKNPNSRSSFTLLSGILEEVIEQLTVMVTVIQNFTAKNDKQLSLEKGEEVLLLKEGKVYDLC